MYKSFIRSGFLLVLLLLFSNISFGQEEISVTISKERPVLYSSNSFSTGRAIELFYAGNENFYIANSFNNNKDFKHTVIVDKYDLEGKLLKSEPLAVNEEGEQNCSFIKTVFFDNRLFAVFARNTKQTKIFTYEVYFIEYDLEKMSLIGEETILGIHNDVNRIDVSITDDYMSYFISSEVSSALSGKTVKFFKVFDKDIKLVGEIDVTNETLSTIDFKMNDKGDIYVLDWKSVKSKKEPIQIVKYSQSGIKSSMFISDRLDLKTRSGFQLYINDKNEVMLVGLFRSNKEFENCGIFMSTFNEDDNHVETHIKQVDPKDTKCEALYKPSLISQNVYRPEYSFVDRTSDMYNRSFHSSKVFANYLSNSYIDEVFESKLYNKQALFGDILFVKHDSDNINKCIAVYFSENYREDISFDFDYPKFEYIEHLYTPYYYLEIVHTSFVSYMNMKSPYKIVIIDYPDIE